MHKKYLKTIKIYFAHSKRQCLSDYTCMYLPCIWARMFQKMTLKFPYFFFYSNFCKMHKHDIENKTNTSGDLPEEIPLITESKK